MAPNLADSWQEFARAMLKEAVARRELSFREFSELLMGQGVSIAPKTLSRRINRGAFDAGFFLMCLTALGVDKLEIEGEQVGELVLKPEKAWRRQR